MKTVIIRNTALCYCADHDADHDADADPVRRYGYIVFVNIEP